MKGFRAEPSHPANTGRSFPETPVILIIELSSESAVWPWKHSKCLGFCFAFSPSDWAAPLFSVITARKAAEPRSGHWKNIPQLESSYQSHQEPQFTPSAMWKPWVQSKRDRMFTGGNERKCPQKQVAKALAYCSGRTFHLGGLGSWIRCICSALADAGQEHSIHYSCPPPPAAADYPGWRGRATGFTDQCYKHPAFCRPQLLKDPSTLRTVRHRNVFEITFYHYFSCIKALEFWRENKLRIFSSRRPTGDTL